MRWAGLRVAISAGRYGYRDSDIMGLLVEALRPGHTTRREERRDVLPLLRIPYYYEYYYSLLKWD
jgi:hypothetical protein